MILKARRTIKDTRWEPDDLNEPSEDEDGVGAPNHAPSVQPDMAHLPVRGQPTIFSGEPVQVPRRGALVTRSICRTAGGQAHLKGTGCAALQPSVLDENPVLAEAQRRKPTE